MSNHFKDYLVRNIKNSIGWSTNRRLLIIEADDYGAIRMSSREARDALMKDGLRIEGNKFDMYDALEDKDDLVQLFDVLNSVKDINGRSAVITAMSVPANPDFDKMQNDEYNNYHYELLPATWQRQKGYDGVKKLWEEGIGNRLLMPQFHGREHLNIKYLLEALKRKDRETLLCFKHKSYGGISTCFFPTIRYVSAFDFDKICEIEEHKKIITDGLNVFEFVFGSRARHFASPGSREHSSLSEVLSQGGIEFLDSDFIRIEHNGSGGKKRVIDYTGKMNLMGQTYIVRNVVFDPIPWESSDWVGYALKQIDIAYKWKKPAIISTHRVNFSGHIEPSNREKGLSMLKDLLIKIKKNWPDVEFITSVELGDIINGREN